MKKQPRLPCPWKQLKRHSLSAEYDDVDGPTWDRFVDGVRRFKVVAGRTVKLHEGKVLDGWQLQRACVEANVKPTYEQVKLPKELSIERYVEILNDTRRHETPAMAMRRADKRRERVAADRRAGKSLRAIAQDHDISERQVRRDLEDFAGASYDAPEGDDDIGNLPTSGASYDAPEVREFPTSGASYDAPEPANGKVCGRDGKTYSANKQAAAEPEAAIPLRLVPIFEPVEKFEEAARLAVRLANLLQEIEGTKAYHIAVDGKKHREHSTFVRAAGRAIEAMTPKCPCPKCGGDLEPNQDADPCPKCQDRGYLTIEEIAQ